MIISKDVLPSLNEVPRVYEMQLHVSVVCMIYISMQPRAYTT